MRKLRKYGVSTASMWPWSVVFGPKGSIRIAKKAGFDRIQALPMKFWSYKRILQWEWYVISYENAWNYGSLWEAIQRLFGILEDPAPNLIDWAMFGQKEFPRISTAIASKHRFCIEGPAEICPELSTRHEDYLDHCLQGGLVTWDTFHVTRPHRTTGEVIPNWKELLEKLPGENIALIHVHIARSDIENFLNGQSELIPMLEMLRDKNTTSPVIIEIFPPLKFPPGMIKQLKKILETVKKYL